MKNLKIINCIDDLESGKRPNISDVVDENFAISLGGENIERDGSLKVKRLRLLNRKYYNEMKKGHIKNGDILINKDGAQTGKFSLYKNDLMFDCAVNEHLFIIRNNEKFLDTDYLNYLLMFSDSTEHVRKKITGSAQPGINSKFLDNLSVSIHDSGEQKKISKILLTQDKIIVNFKEKLKKYLNLKKSIIDNYFEDLKKTKNFSVSNIQDLCENQICYGIVQVGPYIEDGIPVYSIKEMRKSSLININRTSKKIEEKYIRSRVKEGDLLLSIKGTTGVTKIVPNNFSGNISRDITFFRPKKILVTNNFLKIFLDSKFGREIFNKISVGSTRDELSIKKLKTIKIFYPNIDEQNNFLDKIIFLDKILYRVNELLEKNIILKQSLIEDLFKFKVKIYE